MEVVRPWGWFVMLPLKTILHPTDFSEPSESAFRLANSLAADYAAQLVILHVVFVPVRFSDGLILPGSKGYREQLNGHLFDMEVTDHRIDVVRRLEEGSPATEILQVAQVCVADLIVMGTHGRRGLKRLMMGSVAEEVVRKANCPVLMVRSPLLEHEVRTNDLQEESLLSSTPARIRI
jgi:nucleotide-binding universal stress UspA family protein